MQNFPLIKQYIIDCAVNEEYTLKFEHEFWWWYQVIITFPKSQGFKKMSMTLPSEINSSTNKFETRHGHIGFRMADTIEIKSFWENRTLPMNWVFDYKSPELLTIQDILLAELDRQNALRIVEQNETDKKIMRYFQ